jgi:hypothetical protein
MVGLPLEGGGEGRAEEEEIAQFILDTAAETRMHFNVNVGAFVPKPHTPYERAAQIGEDAAWKKLHHIQDRLKPKGHKVGVHDPFVSVIEGVICRGDERVGGLIEEAYRQGCRLDAWTEYLKKDIWKDILREHETLASEILAARKGSLPWAIIDSGVFQAYLTKEAEKSQQEEITLPCMEKCTHPCGVCGGEWGIVKNTGRAEADTSVPLRIDNAPEKDAGTYKLLFSYSKTGKTVFYSHLSLMEIFFAAFTRAGIPALHSEGFNPLPRLEIASPLSLGIAGEGEIASIETASFYAPRQFVERMNQNLPSGLSITQAETFYIPKGMKKYSVSSILLGAVYAGISGKDMVPKEAEKTYRSARISPAGSVFDLRRLEVLAIMPETAKEAKVHVQTGISYFDVFGALYGKGEN